MNMSLSMSERMLPVEETRRRIADAVQHAIAAHLPEAGAQGCAIHAAVGARVIAEVFGCRALPVAGGLIVDGPANSFLHWIPASGDFDVTGKYHCWIECRELDLAQPSRTLHIDLSTRCDGAGGGSRRHGHLGGRRRHHYIWGWADDVRVPLDVIVKKGHVPRGKTLVLTGFPAVQGWIERYLCKHQDSIARIASKALQQLKL